MDTETIVKAKVEIKNTNVDIYFDEGDIEINLDDGTIEFYLSKIECILDYFEDEDVEDFVCKYIWTGEKGNLPYTCSFVNIRDNLSSDDLIKEHKEDYPDDVDDDNKHYIDRIVIGYEIKLRNLDNWQEILRKEIEKGNIFIKVRNIFAKVNL